MDFLNKLETLLAKASPGDWTTRKCNCGSKHCRYTQISSGSFYQGTGFSPEDAELIVEMKKHLPLLIRMARDHEANAAAEGDIPSCQPMELFAYKHGHVSSGNWQWAVGFTHMNRTLNLIEINPYAARSWSQPDCEILAKQIAEALNSAKVYEPTSDEVRELQAITGNGLVLCRWALVEAKGDQLLAQGLLKFRGMAVATNIPKDHWVMERAKEWADEQASKKTAG